MHVSFVVSFYILETSKVISEQVPTCDSAHTLSMVRATCVIEGREISSVARDALT